jgi:hypothetical protein
MPQDLARLASFSLKTWVVEEVVEGEGVGGEGGPNNVYTCKCKTSKRKKKESVFIWI